ncbi:MAG: DUF1893 domain-containing protein [Clostridia bacterium]|nr:DUF1893 domain-containing protein [Clostridia bacterium]
MTSNTDLKKAKELLKTNGCSCVLCGGSDVIMSNKRGIVPLVYFAESKKDFSRFSAADRIVGKAAAFVYVYLNIKNVYADVLSKSAADVFERFGVRYEYGISAENIINREGTGLCPMEQAVINDSDPSDAFEHIKNKLKIMNKKT